jgi:outer membrane protein, multidrug efflux system
VRRAFRPAVIAALVVASACAPKVKYVQPTVDVAPAFRENADWKTAQPADDVLRGNWWELFGDPDLNALEQQIDVSNQTLKAADAQFAQARALVRGTRATLFPTVDFGPSAVRAEASGNRPASNLHQAANDFVLPVDVSYEADVWGRIHSAVSASRAAAQASAADLETARLSLHAELAVDYFALRGADRDRQLLDSAVESFEKALELTQNRFQGGIASQADVAQAETVLETTRAQAVDVAVGRASLEHAIAILVGKPASAFAIGVAPMSEAPPTVPTGVPSALLERRPDIAAAERSMAAANAQIGVATAAFYPSIFLQPNIGYESNALSSLFNAPSLIWSIGASATQTLFDAGRTRANVNFAKAGYDASLASYRGTVLTAMQEVEDGITGVASLDRATVQAKVAVASAQRVLDMSNARYEGGVATYLDVITAQQSLLTAQLQAAQLAGQRQIVATALVKALGGGWDGKLN